MHGVRDAQSYFSCTRANNRVYADCTEAIAPERSVGQALFSETHNVGGEILDVLLKLEFEKVGRSQNGVVRRRRHGLVGQKTEINLVLL
jgi:hypothetical protein